MVEIAKGHPYESAASIDVDSTIDDRDMAVAILEHFPRSGSRHRSDWQGACLARLLSCIKGMTTQVIMPRLLQLHLGGHSLACAVLNTRYLEIASCLTAICLQGTCSTASAFEECTICLIAN